MKTKIIILLTAFLLIAAVSNRIRWTQILLTDRHGTQAKGQASDGTGTSGNCASFNADGSIKDSGLVCSAAVGGSGMVLLEEHTASTSASLDFTTSFSGTYDSYYFVFSNLVPDTNTALFEMRINTGSGFDSGTNYSYANLRYDASTSAVAGGTAQTVIALTRSGNGVSSTQTNFGYSGIMNVANIGTGVFPEFTYSGKYIDGGGTPDRTVESGAGHYEITTTATQIQFLYNGAAKISKGTIRCYGLSK